MDPAVLSTNLGILTGVLQQLCLWPHETACPGNGVELAGHSDGRQGRHYGSGKNYQGHPNICQGQANVLSDTLDESKLHGPQGDLRWLCNALDEGL